MRLAVEINLATFLACNLKFVCESGVLDRRKIVSSLERFDFSERISSVMKGLWGLDEQVTDFTGACLSSIVVRVELKRSK